MTARDGKPCKKCGTSEWRRNRNCVQCGRNRQAEWRRENPEENNQQSREWKRNNPEKHNAQTSSWAKNNRDKVNVIQNRRRTRKTEAGGSYTAAEWKALCKQYNGRCACCGKKTKLTADHVIPVIAGGTSDISNIQPLCLSCNSSKGVSSTDYRTKPGIVRWIQEKLF